MLAELAETARAAYRALVHDDPGFAAFFRDITPIAELSDLRLGSRPAARGRAGPGGAAVDEAPSIDALRAIPWTFAWSQSRINLPGWYGLGSALEAFRAAHGDDGLAEIGRLYRALAVPRVGARQRRDDPGQGRHGRRPALRVARDEPGRRAPLGGDRGRVPPHRGAAAARHRPRPPARRRPGPAALDRAAQPVRRRAVRAPGPAARAPPRDAARTTPSAAPVLRLVQLSVNGVAAGLQNTG